jgi:hypothetical protein
MADVWRAEVPLAAGVVKEVALKLVRGEHEAQGEFVRMFIEEARLARASATRTSSRCSSSTRSTAATIAMELVRGHHLGRVGRARASAE